MISLVKLTDAGVTFTILHLITSVVYTVEAMVPQGVQQGHHQERGPMSGASVQGMSTGGPVTNATFDRGGVSPTRALARRHMGWMLVSGW